MVNVKIQITTQQMIQAVGSQKPPQAFTSLHGNVSGFSKRICTDADGMMEYLQWRRILAAADDLRNTNEFCPCRFWEQMV